MNAKRSPIPFFTDNDVPDGVGDFLKDSGHTVIRLREVMLEDSPDPIIAANCRENGMVLVTHNIKHFRQIVKQYEITKAETDRLCRVELGCKQIDAIVRVKDFLPIIESEWQRMGSTKAGLRIYIGDGILRLHR